MHAYQVVPPCSASFVAISAKSQGNQFGGQGEGRTRGHGRERAGGGRHNDMDHSHHQTLFTATCLDGELRGRRPRRRVRLRLGRDTHFRMASPHKPCWDGWDAADKSCFDSVWRVDFSIHFFTNGSVSCAVLPVCTAEGDEVGTTEPATGVESLLTVVITSSPVRSNPSTRMLLECLASLDRNGGLVRCRKLIMCDGFKVRQRSQRKQGVVTDEEADSYRAFVRNLADLCREHTAFRRTRVVRLARRQGSAYAIREAVEGHVRTPFVIIVPHDCVIARPARLDAVAAVMHAHPERVSYVKLVGPSTAMYAESTLSQYGLRLQPTTEFGSGLVLTPMLRYMDNVSLVSVRFLADQVFVPCSGVRRGTFIEDTFGKQTQMQQWLLSAEFAAKRPPQTGCFLLSDARPEPMMRHLDGKTYLDPEQRAAAGLPAYPTDWTATLNDTSPGGAARGDGSFAGGIGDAGDGDDGRIDRAAPSQGETDEPATMELLPLRDALCWDSMMDCGCSAAECKRLKPKHSGLPVCGRHVTSIYGLWGRRRRPPCAGDCGYAHPTLIELEAALVSALPVGSRLHVHVQTPPCFDGGKAAFVAHGEGHDEPRGEGQGDGRGGNRSLYVVPSGASAAEVDAALAKRAPVALRVAIDVGFDDVMSEGERASLATQCCLCHGITSQAEHRPHVRAPPTQRNRPQPMRRAAA